MTNIKGTTMDRKGVSPPAHRTRRAFTLLEMLIVVAIIGLLAAILFPVFGRVKEAGRRTACASNLKQINLALNQYVQDYKFYPRLLDGKGLFDASGNGSLTPELPCRSWIDKLLSYTKDGSVFVCPSDPDQLYRSGCPGDDTSNPDHPIRLAGSYSLNVPYAQARFNPADHSYSMTYDGRYVVVSPLRYTRPSSTILVSDGINYNWGGFIAPGYTTEPPLTDSSSLLDYGVPDRHSGGVNVLFADGHVKWMSLDSLLKLSLWRINGPE